MGSTQEILFEAWNSIYLGECRKALQDYGLVVEDKEIDKKCIEQGKGHESSSMEYIQKDTAYVWG